MVGGGVGCLAFGLSPGAGAREFGGVVGASDISVAVNKGEVIGVIGANGAGKTTFVNLVTGYLRPSSGAIYYMGRDVTNLTPRETIMKATSKS